MGYTARSKLSQRLALMTVLLLSAAACQGTENDETPPDDNATDVEADGSEAEDATDDGNAVVDEEPVRVGFHWTIPFQDWSGFIVAERQGFYEEEGISVDFNYLQGSSVAVQTTAAGEMDVGVAGPDTLLSGLSEGLPLTAIVNHIQQTPTGVMALSDTGLEELPDLDSLTVSSAQASPEPAMLRALMSEHGMDPESDIDLTFVDPQAKCTIMLAGRTDACTAWQNQHLPQAELEGHEVDFVGFYTDETPLIGHVVFANDGFLESRPETAKAFLRATFRGYQEADEDLDQVLEYYVDAAPDEDEEYLERGLRESHELMRSERTEEHGWGWMTDDAWGTLHDILLDGGVLDSPVDTADIYTNEFLPEEGSEW